jgi:hypothetical protein
LQGATVASCCCWWESAQQLLFIIIFRNKIYYVRVRLNRQSRKEQANNTRAIAQKHIILYPSSSVISFNSKVRGERIVSTFVLLTFFSNAVPISTLVAKLDFKCPAHLIRL